MATIYLIRHGESTANVGGIAQRNEDIALTERGEEQARALAARLPFQPPEVIVSNFIRTQQTAQPWLDQLGMTARVEPLIREFTMLGYSVIKGKTGAGRVPMVKQYWQNPDLHHRNGEDGETFAEFSTRVNHFLDQLPQYQQGSVLFTHGMFINLLMWRLLGYPMSENVHLAHFYSFFCGARVPNTGVYRLSWQTGRDDAHIALMPELSPNILERQKKDIAP